MVRKTKTKIQEKSVPNVLVERRSLSEESTAVCTLIGLFVRVDPQ